MDRLSVLIGDLFKATCPAPQLKELVLDSLPSRLINSHWVVGRKCYVCGEDQEGLKLNFSGIYRVLIVHKDWLWSMLLKFPARRAVVDLGCRRKEPHQWWGVGELPESVLLHVLYFINPLRSLYQHLIRQGVVRWRSGFITSSVLWRIRKRVNHPECCNFWVSGGNFAGLPSIL